MHSHLRRAVNVCKRPDKQTDSCLEVRQTVNRNFSMCAHDHLSEDVY